MFTYFHNNYLYSIVEMQRFAMEPYRQVAIKNKSFYNKYFSGTKYGRAVSASFELFDRVTRSYDKPEFGITETQIDGKPIKIKQETIAKNTFCNLLHFKKEGKHDLPKMLVVAPLSGHYATLLRGTVQGLLPHFDVYITDWVNARDVAVDEGFFTFDDFVRYTINYMKKLGPNLNVMAVCQPSVPVSAAVAMMSKAKDECVPDSMILMGGPIDTRKNPTEVNDYAADRTIKWFESNVISKVPLNYKGAGRSVYPGFMQLCGFIAMNMETHMEAHWDYFNHLVEGDGDSADSHKKFYNEYLSVMDMPAEFYLETVNLVFKKHLLPRGKLVVDGESVNLADIDKTALLCIEGEKDDISGRGQTKAAIGLCSSIPDNRKKYHLQKNVGHYGIFNGRRYRESVVPTIAEFVNNSSTKKKDSKSIPAASTVKKIVSKEDVKKEPDSASKANSNQTLSSKPSNKSKTSKPMTKSTNNSGAASTSSTDNSKLAKKGSKQVKKTGTATQKSENKKEYSTENAKPKLTAIKSSPNVVSINKVSEDSKKTKPSSINDKTGGGKK